MATDGVLLHIYQSCIAGVVACGMADDLSAEILGALLEILLAHHKRRVKRNIV
jgi:hypothetical protein